MSDMLVPGQILDQAHLQAAQDAAIFGAQERYDETEGLRVVGMATTSKTPMNKMEVEFSDGEKVLLSKQQIAALRLV